MIPFVKRFLSSPVVWIVLVLGALAGLVLLLEGYGQVGVDRVYHLF